jgi:hypothetical protein
MPSDFRRTLRMTPNDPWPVAHVSGYAMRATKKINEIAHTNLFQYLILVVFSHSYKPLSNSTALVVT